MPNIGKPSRAYEIIVGDASHYPALTVDYKGRVTGYTLHPAGGSGLITAGTFWNYDISTLATSGYPGDGNIIYNNATQISATALLFSHLTLDSVDIDRFLSLVPDGTTLVIQDMNASQNFQEWLVNGTPTNTNPGTATSYWTFPVSLTASGGTGTTGFPNNHNIIVLVVRPGSVGGFNWRGDWQNVNYAVNDVVRRRGGVYICTNAVTAPDNAPDLYTMRGLWPTRWMANSTAYEDGVSIQSPQFYDSLVELGPTNQTYGNCIVQAINLTVGGTLTITSLAPVATPAFDAGAVALYSSTDQNIGDQIGSVLFSGSAGPPPQSFVVAGLTAGVYFLVAWNYFPISFPAATYFVKLQVVASLGAVISAQPTIKWDQVNPLSTQVGLTLYRGKSWDESFNQEHLTTVDPLPVNWFNSSVAEVQLTGTVNAVQFSPAPSFFDQNDLRLEITQQNGSGALGAGFWTSETKIASASLLPTDLGTAVGDAIIVWFHYGSRIQSEGATTTFIPISWANVKSGVITNLSQAPGALVLLEDLTYTNVATADIKNTFTTANNALYDQYQWELTDLVPATNATDLQLLYSADGGTTFDSTVANYRHAYAHVNASASGFRGNAGASVIIVMASVKTPTAATTASPWSQCWTFKPGNSGPTRVHSFTSWTQNSDNTTYWDHGQCWDISATFQPMNALRYQMSSGNISCRIKTYGVKK